MKRTIIAFALGAMLFAICFSAEAQQAKKLYRIGYLSLGPGIGPVQEEFRKRLGELGYTEGQNLIIEWRFTKGERDRSPAFAAELVNLKADCIIAQGVNPAHGLGTSFG